ncbi:hypothetical protein [Leptospira interrogans]|nr:hypothetical protein [Leptospira interrogans]
MPKHAEELARGLSDISRVSQAEGQSGMCGAGVRVTIAIPNGARRRS